MAANARIKIERINNFEYCFGKSDRKFFKIIAKFLTFDNPDPFAYSSTIQMFDDRSMTFKIGMLSNVIDGLKEMNYDFVLIDYEYDKPSVEHDSRLSGKYLYQRKAVDKFYKKRFGIIKVPTRGGKTFLASEVLRFFLQENTGNFMFITDNTTRFSQAINDIKEFFSPYFPIEIGEVCSGKVDLSKRVTVAMIQTIQSTFSKRCRDKKKKKDMTSYLRNLKFLCIDEIHDNFSESRHKIYLKCINLEFLLCLSATPYKDDSLKKNLKLQAWSGGIIFDIKEEKLRELNVLSDYMVFMLFIDHNDFFIDGDYSEVKKNLIVQNERRNDILIKVIAILKKLNLKTLILFQDISHGTEVSKTTGIQFVSGNDKADIREIAKKEFLVKDGGFLLASDIFKKGITLPQVEVLINVDGGLESTKTIQKKGRVLGVTERKTRSLIIDFFDLDDRYFSKHSETRLDTYIQSIGESNVGILDTSSDDCFKVLKKWIESWFAGNKDCLDIQ